MELGRHRFRLDRCGWFGFRLGLGAANAGSAAATRHAGGSDADGERRPRGTRDAPLDVSGDGNEGHRLEDLDRGDGDERARPTDGAPTEMAVDHSYGRRVELADVVRLQVTRQLVMIGLAAGPEQSSAQRGRQALGCLADDVVDAEDRFTGCGCDLIGRQCVTPVQIGHVTRAIAEYVE